MATPPKGDRRTSGAENLFAEIRELCAVFRVESGMACRMTIDARHTHFDAVVAAAVLRNIRRLLTNISKARRATTVTLSSGTYADGSAFFRVEDNGAEPPVPGETERPAGMTKLCQFIIIDHRLAQLGGELILGDESSSAATIVIPGGLLIDNP